jgi:hypothetical protein
MVLFSRKPAAVLHSSDIARVEDLAPLAHVRELIGESCSGLRAPALRTCKDRVSQLSHTCVHVAALDPTQADAEAVELDQRLLRSGRGDHSHPHLDRERGRWASPRNLLDGDALVGLRDDAPTVGGSCFSHRSPRGVSVCGQHELMFLGPRHRRHPLSSRARHADHRRPQAQAGDAPHAAAARLRFGGLQ